MMNSNKTKYILKLDPSASNISTCWGHTSHTQIGLFAVLCCAVLSLSDTH
jgi:hypothetical protein